MDFEKKEYRTDDEKYMIEALREAQKAAQADEVPVGAVIVKDGEIIAAAHNRVEADKSSSAHAEMIAIAKAEMQLGSKWLNGAVLYVTLEPCCMCAGSMVLARISRLVIGAKDPKSGACGSVINVVNNNNLNHRIDVTTGVLEEECSRQLTEFFRRKRDTNNTEEIN